MKRMKIDLADTIPTRVVDKIGVELPILGHGAARSASLVRYAYDRGVRYFDTAPDYGPSETAIGEGLKGIRDNVCLATKIDTMDVGEVRKSVEKSLEQLQTDHIDIIQIHGSPAVQQMSFEEVMKLHAELVKLRDEHIVRFVGFSAHSYFDRALPLILSGGFDHCMLAYSYLPRGWDQMFSVKMIELRNVCVAKAHELGMSIAAMKVLGGGFLGAGSEAVVPGFDKKRLKQLPAAAIRYVLQDKRIHLLTIGMGSKEEIDANIKTLSGDVTYTMDDRALLAEFCASALDSDPIKAMRVD